MSETNDTNMICIVCGGTWEGPESVLDAASHDGISDIWKTCPACCHDKEKWKALEVLTNDAKTMLATAVERQNENNDLRARITELEKHDKDLTQLMELMIEHNVTPDGEKWAKLGKLLHEKEKYRTQLEWIERKENGWL